MDINNLCDFVLISKNLMRTIVNLSNQYQNSFQKTFPNYEITYRQFQDDENGIGYHYSIQNPVNNKNYTLFIGLSPKIKSTEAFGIAVTNNGAKLPNSTAFYENKWNYFSLDSDVLQDESKLVDIVDDAIKITGEINKEWLEP